LTVKLHIDHQKLSEFCRRRHIRKLWLFGSVLRDDFSDESDVDVLVRFERGRIPGFGIFRIEEGLSELFGKRRIDLVLEEELSHRIKDHSFFQSELLYDEG